MPTDTIVNNLVINRLTKAQYDSIINPSDTEIALLNHQDVSGKEDISNKVTSLSSYSTDTLYPSVKCVYDLIKDNCVFIEGNDTYYDF